MGLALAGCNRAEPAVQRGDRLWADSNYTAALAEYRLALEQGGDDEEVLARIAHAYIKVGQFERGKETYDALVEKAPEYIDQAVFDYVTVARQAGGSSDQFAMSGAVEAALALRPGLPLEEMATPLARYYATTGAPDRAISFYERALARAPADSVPDLLFELGRVHAAERNCAEALGYFNAYRSRRPIGEHADEARWHVGQCSFTLARSALQSGDLEGALRRLDTVVQLGVPQNIQDQAWFERGETLLKLGRPAEALSAYNRVLELNRARTGQLVDRAQRRIDELRFGTGVP